MNKMLLALPGFTKKLRGSILIFQREIRSYAIVIGLCLFGTIGYSQSVTMSIQGGFPDNCANPLPNAGTYTLNGTSGGKNAYYKGTNLRIIWTGTQWELQTKDPCCGAGFSAAWYNTVNTTTPPATCWTASFGCFPIQLSGPDAINIVPSVTSQPTGTTICSGSNTSFGITASGALATYQWQVSTNGGSTFSNITNGGVYSSATTSTLNITAATAGMNAYQYHCVVTGPCNDVATSTAATLTVNGTPSVSGQPSNSTVCLGCNTTFAITATGSSLTYQWQVSTNGGSTWSNLSNGGVYSNVTAATMNITGATSGMNSYQYHCVVNGTCSPAATSNAATLTIALAATISSTSVTCNGASTGSATVTASGGTTPYTYSWAPSGGTAAIASGLSSGNYTCTVTDASSTTVTATVNISQPVAISSSVSSQTNVSCNGGSNGAATVSASGGTGALTYAWSPSGGSAATASSLAQGNYTCTITDANSCTKTQVVNITQPAAISSSISSQTNVSCNGGSNGAVTVSASGGTGAFTYAWSPSGGTAATASGLAQGNYTCTITDANACIKKQTVSITQPAVLNLSTASQTNVSTPGGNDGAASVNAATGGTAGYTYNWTPGNPTGDGTTSVTGLTAGAWTCTVTDANNCTTSQTFTITQPTGPPASALNFDGVNDKVNCGSPLNSILSGGNKFTLEAWVNPANTNYLGVIAGNYSTNGSGMQFLLRRDNSNYTFWIDAGAGFMNVTSSTTVVTNTWTHLAGTWDGSVMKLYINGVLDASNTLAPGSGMAANANELWLGGNATGTPEMFAGSIDELRIWNRTLCQGEIQNNMNGELPAPRSNLLMYYKFNEGYSLSNNSAYTTLIDSSGNGSNGTLVNFSLSGASSNWVDPGAVTTGSYAPVFTGPNVTITGNMAINYGGSEVLTAGGANTYAWSANAGSATTSTVSVNPTTATNYSVTGTDNLGCVHTSTFTVFIKGAALNFDGADDAITINDSPSLDISQQITIEAWVYATNGSGIQNVISKSNCTTSNSGYIFPRTDDGWNNFVAYFHIGGGWQTLSAPYAGLNQWHHLAATYDGTYIRLYQDGVLAATSLAIPGSIAVNANPLSLGTQPGCGEFFQGNIDEARVWNRALCRGEIQNNMNGELILPQTGLAAYYRFNQGIATLNNSSDNIAIDSSGNGNNGTLTNFALNGNASNWVAPGAVITSNQAPAFISPTVTISGNTTICTGATTTLTAIGGVNTYTWTSGSSNDTTIVSPTANTTYSVAGTNSVGCTSNTAVATVTVNALPNVTAIASSPTVCASVADTLTATGASTYTWSGNAGGATTPTVAVTETLSTTYTVTGTDANGCVNTNTVTITVQNCGTGEQYRMQNSGISIFPNPTTGALNLVSEMELGEIEVYDMLSRRVYSAVIKNKTVQIDLGTNTGGIYYIKVQGKSLKIVKE